jgi:predicted DsbA family dithiol-disulfide isomerase
MRAIRIDFVSDVVCPWCVIGLKSLETALANASDVISADIHFQPFELNPQMPPEGQNIAEHIAQKYGSDPERSRGTRDLIRNSAAAFGFTINSGPDSRIWNTFDAHRLLHWAGTQGRQAELKNALFTAYFTNGQNPGDPDVLAAAAVAAGLDETAARDVIASGRYIDDVRTDERFWREQGISAVPAIVLDGKYLILGGQPPEAFERALRKLAAEEPPAGRA